MNSFAKYFTFVYAWNSSFHPDKIGYRAESNSANNGIVNTPNNLVVSFARSWCMPVPEDSSESNLFSKFSCISVRKLHAFSHPGINISLGFSSFLHCVCNSIGVSANVSFSYPFILVSSIFKSANVWVSGTSDKWMITWINSVFNEGCRFSISSTNKNGFSSKNITLKTSSGHTVHLFADWYKNFSSHVSAFFSTWFLVFQVNSCSTTFYLHLDELHYRSHASKTGITISNDWAKKVDSWGLCLFF
mmetsp:Transcript_11728/g.37338  ORF Transcript_11728/g.37338 Transcript_11728/m.37338 type:complete len:246 (+) Transcript_11728:516-1253(+)